MSKFQRGFKSDCERIAADVRRELSTPDEGPINLHALAEYLDIPLRPLDELVSAASMPLDTVLLEITYRSVSAVTVFEGKRRSVVYNERHSPGRHRSNLAHEFAHALLLHPPEGSTGLPALERINEAEAAWLGGVLLLTGDQAARIARAKVPTQLALEQYEISRDMLVYRLRTTGALKRFPQYSLGI
jgi:hypothetical protein